jgi:transcriptional regulator with XRE-family HTH domain
MTLKRVAEGSGISVALLSQVERGRVDPSVNTLRKLAEFLGVSVGYFFEDDIDDSFVIHKDSRKMLKMAGGITYHLLSTKTAPNLEVIFNSFEVGATTGVGFYSHPGEECGVVLEGALQVELSDRIFILEQGDSISFSSSIPHRLSNAGITPAKAIWVNTPAEF